MKIRSVVFREVTNKQANKQTNVRYFVTSLAEIVSQKTLECFAQLAELTV